MIYLVEKFSSEAHLGLPINTLHQATINSQVVDNFFIKKTNNHKQSMAYLSALTKLLTSIFKVSLEKNSVLQSLGQVLKQYYVFILLNFIG